MARAICSGCSSRARTIHRAIRSAERGPTAGICRSCVIKFRIAAGYSVLLKALRFVPKAIASTEEEAAPACANKIAMAHRLHSLSLVPSEIRYRLRPSAFLDKEPRRSRKHPAARRVPAWLPLQAKLARKFQADHANLTR